MMNVASFILLVSPLNPPLRILSNNPLSLAARFGTDLCPARGLNQVRNATNFQAPGPASICSSREPIFFRKEVILLHDVSGYEVMGKFKM